MRIVVGGFLATTLAGLAFAAATPKSHVQSPESRVGFETLDLGPWTWDASRLTPRERFDEDGRVIERIWHDGRLLQYSWDTSLDRVERIDGGTEEDGVVWTHMFTHDAGGALSGEYDCVGNHHAPDASAAIDMDRGTALSDHKHGGER